ncbi:MAG: hypothetical protein RR382_00745 [Tannerellaceae bacterium]
MDKPNLSPKEYAFYEWMIIVKNLNAEIFDKYTLPQKIALFGEFSKEYDGALKIDVKGGEKNESADK